VVLDRLGLPALGEISGSEECGGVIPAESREWGRGYRRRARAGAAPPYRRAWI
jgi:hypothetical protein